MQLAILDWLILFTFIIVTLCIGIYASKTAGKSSKDFFLSGRNMPWWLLGVSMVATTFSCDTPNLVTDLVRQRGVYGNWAWWAFLLTGMLTVFIYAKLWRRSGVMTDIEFYEIRYSGRLAAALRGFRAVYLGFFFNIMVIALVSLAMIKVGAIMLNWTAPQTLIILSTITLIYSALGGLRGIILTDFFQFFLALVGAIIAAWYLLNIPEVGGLNNLLTHENVAPKLSILPDFGDREMIITLLIIPLAVQWWSVWYPGSEPGGGGYIAQRMLAAKNELDATKATLFFNFAHYALRPWPWILVALCSLVVYPDLDSLAAAFPNINPQFVKDDLAYPAMLTFLPAGILGLVVTSLVAAYMSTVSTQLNWGASYLVNDFYTRFVSPQASEKDKVRAGRIFTVMLMFFAGIFSLALSNALQAFQILLQVGAGTGLIFILRWFWWRINAYSELTAMIVSFFVALYFQFGHERLGFTAMPAEIMLISGVAITTVTWLIVTLLTPADPFEKLCSFYRISRPGGPGWRKVVREAEARGIALDSKEGIWTVPYGVLCLFLGTLAIYLSIFATGYWLYLKPIPASICSVAVVILFYTLYRIWLYSESIGRASQ